MKKNILYVLLGGLLLSLAACSENWEDATSKHVYGENENPYLRADAEATVTKRYNLVPVKHKSSICLTMLNYFK